MVSGTCSRARRCCSVRVVDGAHAVVDARHLEQVEGLGDVLGRALLAGVGDGEEARLAGHAEDVRELARRMADLGGVQPHAGDHVAVGPRRLEGDQGARAGSGRAEST